jgi:NAD+ synthase (glutamine-hydrolysing)
MAFFHQGFLRVACAVPLVKVADPKHNAAQVISLLQLAEQDEVALVVFPELCLTGYTCGDLFGHDRLQRAALDALDEVQRATASDYHGVAIVGLPLVVNDQLFNVAATLHAGRILGVTPKTYLPNYKEFYEARWFSPATRAARFSALQKILGQWVRFGPGQLIPCAPTPAYYLGVEICEDLWVPEPPSSRLALRGATVLCNLSASNDLIGKAAWRRELVASQSGRCLAAYLYASCGAGESTTDVVYGGHCLIAENGTIVAESTRLQRQTSLLIADIDLERLVHDRLVQGSFADWNFTSTATLPDRLYPECADLNLPEPKSVGLRFRTVDPHPFVPRDDAQRGERCAEIFGIQVAALAQRLDHVGAVPLALGVSGGLDSTLALLVACKTLDQLRRPRTDLGALTLPGFGTSRRTLENARTLLKHLGVAWQEIDIRGLCLEEMRLLGHQPFGIDCSGLDVDAFAARLRLLPPEKRDDLVFENVQARMRTNLLMNRGFVIGTSDLSELAVGWCTYNGDHMSMYNPNVSIPKTLVKWLIGHVAETEFSGPAQAALRDVLATEISPELLPLGADGAIAQNTEATIGPYELIDFFLYHFLRHGASPERILYLAEHAQFDRAYGKNELHRWLKVFLRRFFANQFKRSCLPDGPKVGTVSLSPRGDWRMPSDASAKAWLDA